MEVIVLAVWLNPGDLGAVREIKMQTARAMPLTRIGHFREMALVRE